MNLGGSSSARTSKRTKAVASLVASVISKPAVAAAWRSSQPSPRTANACARRSAAGSTRRTRAITRRPMPSSPPTSSSAGSISAACRSLRSSARRSSVAYNGLPPLAVHTASHNPSVYLLPNWRARACRRRFRSTTQDAESSALRRAAPTASLGTVQFIALVWRRAFRSWGKLDHRL